MVKASVTEAPTTNEMYNVGPAYASIGTTSYTYRNTVYDTNNVPYLTPEFNSNCETV